MAGTARGKMKQILGRDWLPARSRWSYLTCSGLPVTRPPLFTVNPYRKIPVVSPGLTQLRKGFLVSKRKLFWQGRAILAKVVWLRVNNCCKGDVACLYQEGV